MELKPALLVIALAAAAVVTAGCEQRGATDTASKRDTASGSMAQTTPPATPSTNTAPGTTTQKASNAADDAAITAKVKAAILAEPGLKSLQISVDTKDQTVTLSGNVSSDQMRDRAKQIAMSTEGVKNVVDNLSIKSS